MTDAPTMAPIHPGEILQVEYLEPLGVTQHRLAVAIGVPPRRINEIVHAKRGITADTALRLARYSARASASGSTCRAATSWRTNVTGSRQLSMRSSRSPRGRACARPRSAMFWHAWHIVGAYGRA